MTPIADDPESETGSLAPNQQGLWLRHQLLPDDPANHLCFLLEWRFILDPELLGAALSEVAARHEPLRTTFALIDGTLRQQVHPPAAVRLEQAGLPPLAPDQPERDGEDAALEDLARAAAAEPFDLAAGPLLRATLVHRRASSALILVVHHIVMDAWSLDVLARELGELYGSGLAGRAAELHPLAANYRDFAGWWQGGLTPSVLAAGLAHWSGTLSGAGPVDWPGAGHRRGVASAHRFTLPPAQAAELAELGHQHGATTFMVLLAGFVSALHRWTGSRDVALGSAITRRERTEFEPLIGFFLNTLVLRTRIESTDSFASLLHRVRAVTLAAMGHRDVPFDLLVRRLRPPRPGGALPLINVLFAHSVRVSPTAPDAPGVSEVHLDGARADLTLSFEEVGETMNHGKPENHRVPGRHGDTLHGVAEYDMGLFNQAAIKGLCDDLLYVLHAAGANPSLPLEQL